MEGNSPSIYTKNGNLNIQAAAPSSIVFKTNSGNITAGAISAAGNWGMNTSAPVTTLQVVGGIVASTGVYMSTLTVQGSAFSVGNASFSISGGSATVAYQLKATALYSTGQTIAGGTMTVQGTSFSVGGSAVTGGAAAFSVTASSVGIETTTPGSALDVEGSGIITSSFTVGGYNILGAAYPWTPTLACVSGSLTTSSAAGSLIKIGKQVNYQVKVTLTSVGTCGSGVSFSVPQTFATQCVMSGYESASTGYEADAYCAASGTTCAISLFNQGVIEVNGYVFNFSGNCQVQ